MPIMIRQDIVNFSREMEKVLQESEVNGGYEERADQYLMRRFETGLVEMTTEILKGRFNPQKSLSYIETNYDGVQKAFANLANTCMMIHCNLERRKKKKPELKLV